MFKLSFYNPIAWIWIWSKRVFKEKLLFIVVLVTA
jgi:hypothetical protein